MKYFTVETDMLSGSTKCNFNRFKTKFKKNKLVDAQSRFLNKILLPK